MKAVTVLALGMSAFAYAQDPVLADPVPAPPPAADHGVEAISAQPISAGIESSALATSHAGSLVKQIEFSDATVGKLSDVTFTLNPIAFSAPKNGYMNLFFANSYDGVEDKTKKVSCKYSLNALNPAKASSDVSTLYLPGDATHPAELRLTLLNDLKAAESDVLRVFCSNFPMPSQSHPVSNGASFILSDKPYSSDPNAEQPTFDRLVDGIELPKIYSKEEGGAPHPVTIYAISATGTRPMTTHEVEATRNAITAATGLKKEEVEFAQTTVLHADGQDVVMTLFLIKSPDYSRDEISEMMKKDGSKYEALQTALNKQLPAYKDIRQTFAQEYMSGTCFNGIKVCV